MPEFRVYTAQELKLEEAGGDPPLPLPRPRKPWPEQSYYDCEVLTAARMLRRALQAGFQVPAPPEGVKIDPEKCQDFGFTPEEAAHYEAWLTRRINGWWQMIFGKP